MKKTAVLLIALVLGSTAAFAEEFNARVLFAKDGDDLIVRYGDITLDIRLLIADAPEIRGSQPWALEAKEALHALTAGEFVHISYKKKSYGRPVGIVTLSDGRIVNDIMIKEGHAWAYCGSDGNPGRGWQNAAKAQKLGLWAASEEPVNPCDWRDGSRKAGS